MFKKVLILVLVAFVASGCNKRPRSIVTTEDATPGSGGSMSDSTNNVDPYDLNSPLDPSRYGGFSSVGELRANNIVYFNYNSYELLADSRRIIEAHSTYMRDFPQMLASLEGHADERGTPEYNLALGEERSKAASSLMNALGVDGSRLELVSWGEERPAVVGNDEFSYAKNRRVEIIYKQ